MQTKQRLHINAPLLRSTPLSQRLDCAVWLKMEALQPSGSFKIRGIGYLCQHHLEQGTRGFAASSGGNAGIAVAYAGKILQCPVTVIIPETSPAIMRTRIEAEGATVFVHGKNWNEADRYTRRYAEEHDYAYIPPYDHPLIWRGHASLVHEIKQAGVRPDLIVLAVGGGGLLCGVMQGLHECGWLDIPIIAMEAAGAASLTMALTKDQWCSLPDVNTIATSLATRSVAKRAFEWAQQKTIRPVMIDDDTALKACLQFADDHRLLVEPACGVALALAYQHPDFFKAYCKPLFIVCGGNGVTMQDLHKWHAQYQA